MKKTTHIWIIPLLAWAMVSLACTPAGASETSPEEAYALELVTQIRQDPLTYVHSLGYNSEELVVSLPWLSTIRYDLTAPIKSLILTQQAAARNSTDPAVPEPGVNVNTDFAATGDITGVVSFINYLAPEAAIAIVINNQLKKELDPLYDGKRLILSPDYPLMGTALKAGRIPMAGQVRNAYYIHICFASSMLKSAVQVVNLINQVRANPLEANKYLSFNLDFLSGGPHPPLFLDHALGATAAIRLTTPIDVLAHARYFGFSGTQISERSVIETFPLIDPDRFALWMFSSLMLQEVISNPSGQTFLHPTVNAIGPSLYHLKGQAHESVKLTVVSGRKENLHPDVSRVYGVAFVDLDGNGVYTPGEEAPDRLISAYDVKTQTRVASTVTSRAGQFEISGLPANAEYRIQSGVEPRLTKKLIFLTTDQFVRLQVK